MYVLTRRVRCLDLLLVQPQWPLAVADGQFRAERERQRTGHLSGRGPAHPVGHRQRVGRFLVSAQGTRPSGRLVASTSRQRPSRATRKWSSLLVADDGPDAVVARRGPRGGAPRGRAARARSSPPCWDVEFAGLLVAVVWHVVRASLPRGRPPQRAPAPQARAVDLARCANSPILLHPLALLHLAGGPPSAAGAWPAPSLETP